MKRTAFFISDGTGITAETLGQSLLAQFETISFTKLTRPYIDSVDKARAMLPRRTVPGRSSSIPWSTRKFARSWPSHRVS
jgi:regulator of PEP synthase PpsR (kinase-PPPase family)